MFFCPFLLSEYTLYGMQEISVWCEGILIDRVHLIFSVILNKITVLAHDLFQSKHNFSKKQECIQLELLLFYPGIVEWEHVHMHKSDFHAHSCVLLV